ncbi:MAG: DNA/RNA nuclease SfsA [Firmicutes bacterium HGW-Firmicutes-14]|nr:MAG: DNA/RNA nuclease SfsA [Firmicutes bacterium HGW-Firmicutes-14]
MIKAQFVERRNRFMALVRLESGETVAAHVPNSGRLRELFRPGREIYLEEKPEPHRVTKYDLALVEYNGNLVSVDARVPNRVVADAVENRELPEFSGYRVVRQEVKYGASRLDMLLENKNGLRFYVEVKSVTLVKDGIAMFPDAPTVRGARHMAELAGAVAKGYRGAAVFLIQREDARAFTPNDTTDPNFGEALREAAGMGVEIYAFLCNVSVMGVRITRPIPVWL